MDRKVKIVATLGPASGTEEIILKLAENGMDVARLNFSHGDHYSHGTHLEMVRKVSTKIGRPIAVLQDLQGPKIRVGLLTSPITLLEGDEVPLFQGKSNRYASEKMIPIDLPQLFAILKKGDVILLDDGRLKLRVKNKKTESVTATVLVGGTLSSHKGINLPGIKLAIPAVTKKDFADLKFGLTAGVDAVALSFIQTAEDVLTVKKIIRARSEQHPLLIAKLERPIALENLQSIMEHVDGVMVARGDLGVEMVPEAVPGVQKRIIKEANLQGKIVITATQMLETMIHSPLPTRAEASDVANAVYDGTDAVMLSGETAVGEYPVETVAMMNRIVVQAEQNYDLWGHGNVLLADDHNDAEAIVRAARELAHDRDVEVISVFTRTGRTAILMAKARPCVPILAFTPFEQTYRKLALAWGVIPVLVPWADTVEEMIAHVEKSIRQIGLVRKGGQIVLVSGFPVSDFRQPNMALLHTVN